MKSTDSLPMGPSGIASAHPAPHAKHLSAIARAMYPDGPILRRKMQHWRPYICPFESLIGYVQAGSRVLDVGCGAGLLLSLLSGLGHEFDGVGFDVSHEAIETATKMAKRAATASPRARLSFTRLDFDSPWPAGEFDVVFLVDVLHHVSPANQRDFLLRVISKVRRSGVLVYKDMCMNPWWKAQANRLHDLVVAREAINYVPVTTVELWASAEKMQIVHRRDVSRFWYGHELRVMTYRHD